MDGPTVNNTLTAPRVTQAGYELTKAIFSYFTYGLSLMCRVGLYVVSYAVVCIHCMHVCCQVTGSDQIAGPFFWDLWSKKSSMCCIYMERPPCIVVRFGWGGIQCFVSLLYVHSFSCVIYSRCLLFEDTFHGWQVFCSVGPITLVFVSQCCILMA